MEMKTTGTIDRAGWVRLEQGRKRVRAYLAGNVVADTTQPRLVWEVPYYPAYYFPVEDMRTDLLVPTATVSHSPSRGDAQHFTIKAGSREAEDAALRYVDSPIEELRDLIRLDWDAMDGWFEEDEEVYTHPRDPYTRVDILATSRRVRAEHVEVSALALHLLQSSLVLINTRLLDRVLEEPVWAQRMTKHDRRGLSPLFWSNVALYGRWHLDMDQRIDFDRGPDTDSAGPGAGESSD